MGSAAINWVLIGFYYYYLLCRTQLGRGFIVPRGNFDLTGFKFGLENYFYVEISLNIWNNVGSGA